MMTSQDTCMPKSRLGYLILMAVGLSFSACSGSGDDSGMASDEVAQANDMDADDLAGDDGPQTSEALEPGSKDTSDGSQELPTNGDANPGDGVGEPDVGGLPVDPNADPAGGTSLNLNELLETENCKAGWLPEDPESEPDCNATYSNICFEKSEDACACAGCADDACLIAESDPAQVSCEVETLGCNFKWFDICYETAAEACEAAGCDEESCTILESFPAQVSCD